MSNYNPIDELNHHGIPGMRWGIRRYQNKDGSLTAAGRKRVAKMKDEYTELTGKKLIRKPTPKDNKSSSQNGDENVNRKSIKNMSDTEIQNRINRLQKEKQLIGLQSETASKGEKFVSTVGKQVIAPAAIDAGRRLLTDVFMKKGSNLLGLNEKDVKDTKDVFEELKKEAKTSQLKRQIEQDKDWFEERKQKQEIKKAKEAAKKVKINSYDDPSDDKESIVITDYIKDTSNRQTGESFIDDIFKKKKS